MTGASRPWSGKHLKDWALQHNISLMSFPAKENNNAHMFYIVCNSEAQRESLIKHLKQNNILAVFHYISLHSSEFYKEKHDGRVLHNSDKFTNTLLRLPMYYELNPKKIVNSLIAFTV